ncbi:D-isomer specific 2-hydroxyacid dehydrogenase NAD-binding protein [Arcobacter nitrofigilis DSM 7299]|uniref:D-isomer specific 2-hydroxyacid dehydrogenase NAD-binding protein n=1 Tax=Arcobacter nitrofigilis (strain ATCC 33309 / DSM 7299 / CCUG 15893 / LMG 7604 / NCTC 12251 / CI) TaxID=572480 RepID=D5V3A8_ARCNC|nr:2-hydroxyacid dehydrogenase [Arcobacter nitrofigilis]ADG92690.1 D-isomer specific 2-hydroxyacid dehydrogenase NAD-binding protein [Arcobacter nitrofigilis DSM 7299]
MKKVQTILQIADLTEEGNKRLGELFNVVLISELENHQDEITGLVTTGGNKVEQNLIEKLPKLEVIFTRGVGFDHIDLETAFKRGIVVSNTPDVLTDCVADFAFGALIAISRKIVQADSFVRSGKWLNNKFSYTTKVSGKKLGIVGFGRIGKAVAKRAAAFDMDIRYFSRVEKSECKESFEPSLLNLAKWADYLVICAPGGKSTYNMITLEVLEALGEKGFLINIARGSLIDEKALIQAITEGKIEGAALDVFANEPVIPEELLESSNVILLPHIASRTIETFQAMEDLLFLNLEKYFTSGTLITQVEKG